MNYIKRSSGHGGVLAGFLALPLFLGFAAFLIFGPALEDLPRQKNPSVNPQMISYAPRRETITAPPSITIDGFTRSCMDCHRIFPPRDIAPSQLLRHEHIRLEHGINNRCRNCHDVENRDQLVLHSGEAISFSQVVSLCKKCHGPTFRDWELGMHGRSNGFWDKKRGKLERLSCTQCHDPHIPRQPAMDPIRSLPGPHTLRMGIPHGHDQSTVPEEDPLRRGLYGKTKKEGER